MSEHGALDRARSFSRAAKRDVSSTQAHPRRDLPFDGQPNLIVVRSKADNCPLQVYNWPAFHNAKDQPQRASKGIIFLLHGVRAHLRLTWLAKRPPHLANRPTPLSCVSKDSLEPLETLGAEETWCDIHSVSENEGDQILEETNAGDTSSFGHQVAGSVMSSATRSPRSRKFSEATNEEKECQVFYEGSWIEALNGAGYEIYGMDLRGHGRSGGERCSVLDFDLYCTDVTTVIEQVIWGRHHHGGVGRSFVAGEIRPKLIVIGVSLSTLILCKVLQKPSTQSLHIYACALFSGFLKEGAKYSTRPIKTFLKLLVKLRHFLPNLPLVLPQKPETRGPSWQLRYGDEDPYLCKRPFTVRMVGTCVAALQEFDDTKDQLANAGACKHLKMFHNYYDMVNPVDGSLEVYSWLMEHCRDQDVQCTIFNSSEVDSKQINSWHPKVEFDKSPLDLGHTLITDTDNLYVFQHFFKWLKNI